MASKEDLLQAVQNATRTLAGTGHIDSLLPRVLAICVNAVGAEGGTIYLHDEANHSLVFRHVVPETVREKLEQANIPDDFGVAGKVFQSGRVQISNFPTSEEAVPNSIEEQTGVHVHSMITVPLAMKEEKPIGVVQLINKGSGPFDESDSTVLDTVASVATMAIVNAKLSEEASRASTLLGMGKVSHDIGNLAASLHANVGVFGLAMDSLQGTMEAADLSADSQFSLLRDIANDLELSIDRIVGYSRLISDLSAGRSPRPNLNAKNLADTIEIATSYLESEARSKGIDLVRDIQPGAPDFDHDELFVIRIVQNLVGNAIKAICDLSDSKAKRISVSYKFEGNAHHLSVEDSGPGMDEHTARRILSGTAISNWTNGSGSGWGTKIVLELACSLGGTVEIESKIGVGSAFLVNFPAAYR